MPYPDAAFIHGQKCQGLIKSDVSCQCHSPILIGVLKTFGVSGVFFYLFLFVFLKASGLTLLIYRETYLDLLIIHMICPYKKHTVQYGLQK